MKSFTFRLESVLSLRIREEDRARELCAKALSDQAAALMALTNGNSELDSCHAELSRQRSGKTTRNQQILLLSALQQQQLNCKRLMMKCASADHEVAARRGELLIARRKRESLSNLKERQRAAHRLAQDREQEALIADIISSRHVINLREAHS